MKGALPQNLKPLFWSYDFDKLGLERNKKLIIVQIINYGNWEEWQWLIKNYGVNEVKKCISEIAGSEFRPEALRLASLLIGIEHVKHSSGSAR